MEKKQDAIMLLKADHKAVEKMFKQFEKLKEDEDATEEKVNLVAQICSELTVHAEIEEEIFYPAVRAATEEGDLMDEALVEHASAKEFIAQLQSMKPDDEFYDAKVTVLGEYVMHHVEEEEGEMFPKAKKAKVDMQGLGDTMSQRKEELQAEMQSPEKATRSVRKSPASTRHATH